MFNGKPGFPQGFNAVMQKKYLPAPFNLAADCPRQPFIVVFFDDGFYGVAVAGRCGKQAHVPDFKEAHVEGAGDGRCREGQAVNVGFQFLQAFLVFNAKALLFVNYDKAKVFELHITLNNPVGADEQVYFPRGKLFQNHAGCFLVNKTGKHRHANRKL